MLIGAGCTRPNPVVCCTSPADCSALGIHESTRDCNEGFVCVDHQCSTPMTPDDAAIQLPCTMNADCSPPTPYCGPIGLCVECMSSDHCSGTTPVCETADNLCRACSQDDECSSLVCDTSSGACADETTVLYASESGISS